MTEKDAQKVLADSWNIEDKASLLERIKWLSEPILILLAAGVGLLLKLARH